LQLREKSLPERPASPHDILPEPGLRFVDAKRNPVIKMAVREMSRSGKPEELLDAAGISAACIVRKVKEIS
jgi:hypothetical protein